MSLQLSWECINTVPRRSDGPLFAFSLFTPTIIHQVGAVTLPRLYN